MIRGLHESLRKQELAKYPLPTCTSLDGHSGHIAESCDKSEILECITVIKMNIAHNSKTAQDLYDEDSLCEAIKFELANRQLYENMQKLSEHVFLLTDRDLKIKDDRNKFLKEEIVKLANVAAAAAKSDAAMSD